MLLSKAMRLLPTPAGRQAHGVNNNNHSVGNAPVPVVAASPLLDRIADDVYYCFLVPLLLPITILAFYANWVSLKFVRHK